MNCYLDLILPFDNPTIDWIVLYIGMMVRVFANGPGDVGSIPGWVIPKTLKMVLDASLFNTQHYKLGIKGKVGQCWERSGAHPIPWCSSYWKGSLRVTLDYGRQLNFIDWIIPLLFFYKDGFIMDYLTHEGWYVIKIRKPNLLIIRVIKCELENTEQFFDNL